MATIPTPMQGFGSKDYLSLRLAPQAKLDVKSGARLFCVRYCSKALRAMIRTAANVSPGNIETPWYVAEVRQSKRAASQRVAREASGAAPGGYRLGRCAVPRFRLLGCKSGSGIYSVRKLQ